MKTPQQRAEDAIPWHLKQARQMAAQDAIRRRLEEECGPRTVSDEVPKPFLTVGGERQDFGSFEARRPNYTQPGTR